MVGQGNQFGLTNKQANAVFNRIGPNQIEKTKQFSALKLFFSQFTSPLIYILLFAAIVTWFLKDFVDMWVILAAVAVNTVLGFYQEFKAQKSLEALSKVLSAKTVVIRDGKRLEIDSSQVVPGDLVILQTGEKVPADGVLIYHKDLSINEAILTGESQSVFKSIFKTAEKDGILKGFTSIENRGKEDKTSSLYMGTIITTGVGQMVAVYTGGLTEVGKIAKRITKTHEEDTPLQKRIKRFSNGLSIIVGIIGLIILTVGLLTGNDFEEIFTLSVAVAVAAIPEGLAVSLTTILAIGMQRILKQKALVRKLLAAEVLGSVSVICADKTGTLTEGNMKVIAADSENQRDLVYASTLGNNLQDPLELGMWDWAKKSIAKGVLGNKNKSIDDLIESNKIIDQIPFKAEKRFSIKITKESIYVIGAPEHILSMTNLPKKQQSAWQNKISSQAKLGRRIVGFATKKNHNHKQASYKLIESELNWLGFLVYQDPVREGVAPILKRTIKAGIDVKVITGDFKDTAVAILSQLGITLNESQIIEGSELNKLPPKELAKRVSKITLFARTTPEQKLKIVEALQNNNHVVAMTGDGVNDAPALKKADIGIVVSSASDVSKETADIVLLDDNFATIVKAIEEGRGIFDNLRKIILYLLSDSFTEVIIVLGSLALGLPLPITAAQILWVNLVDDGLPNLALTIDPKERGLLNQKPRSQEEPLVDAEIKTLIFLISIVTGVFILFIFSWYLSHKDLDYARTVAFAVLGIDSLLYVFSARSLHRPIWKSGVFDNKWLIGAVIIGAVIQLIAIYVPFFQEVFKTHPLALVDWGVILISGVLVVAIIEIVKWAFIHNKYNSAKLST
jgi:Ca2+-transporting ATPase